MDLLSLSWWRVVFAKGGRVFGFCCAIVFILPIVITAGISLNQRHSNQPEQQSGTIATVNGDPITARDFEWIPAENLGGAPGSAHASAYGRAVYSLVVHKVIEQIAKKQNIHASDADVDRAIAKAREGKVGANASDQEWDSYLSDRMHASSAEFRDYMTGEASVQALLDHYKNAEKVTVDDAKNQYSEVQLATVFVASKSATSAFPGAPKSLPDADAEKMAKGLHDKVAAGADIIPFAKANADVFQPTSKTTGISGWQKENQENQLGSALNFGPDVDAAVRKTPKGMITDVVKATGFQSGYFFAKVVDRRVQLPKDYDVNKVTASLKEQRGYKKLDADLKAAVKVAKVIFPKEQLDKKAYYDYAKMQVMEQEQNGTMGMPAPDAPSKTDVDAQKALVDADFEAELKAHPDDTTAVLLVAESLQLKRMTALPADRDKIQDRLITLYETAFKTTEDIPTRFTLAGLYRDKHDYKSAFKQYAMVNKLLGEDPAYDLNTRQKQLGSRQQLLGGLNGIPTADAPEAAALITEQNTKISELTAKIEQDRKKQAEETRKQEAEQKKATEEAAKKKQDAIKGAPAAPPAGSPTAPAGATAPPTQTPPPGKPGTTAAPPPTASTPASPGGGALNTPKK